MIRKSAICVLLCVLSIMVCNAQKHTIVASSGYGFPSIYRFILSYENKTQYYYNLNGAGPFHNKLEYVYDKKVGASISGFYNTLNFNFKGNNNLNDTFKYQVRDFSIVGRLNYYFINKPHHQLYIGAGIGKIYFNNKVVRITNPEDTFLKSTPVLTDFNKTILESTFGYRYFFNNYIGLYSEIGAGRVIKQFAKNGAIDSYIQLGVSLKWQNKLAKAKQKIITIERKH
jgi:hypothetical protein